MLIFLVYQHNNGRYRAHAANCSQAKSGPDRTLLPETFDSVEGARAFADADEREKGGEYANFKACECIEG